MWRVFLPHNFLCFLKSLFYFLFSKKDNFKILFYTSSNFNRGEKNINYFIDPLYNLSLKNKINALVYEEPFLINNKNRSKNYIKVCLNKFSHLGNSEEPSLLALCKLISA